MNEIKRYDQELAEQLAQIALPDENASWAAMKKMLDEADDDPVIIPFYRRFGCGLLGLIGLLLLSAGGWFYFQHKEKEKVVITTDLPERNSATTDSNRNTAGIKETNTKNGQDSSLVLTGENDLGNTQTNAVNPLQQPEVLNEANLITAASRAKTTSKIHPPGLDERSDEGLRKRRNKQRTVQGKTTLNIRPATATADGITAMAVYDPGNLSYTNAGKTAAPVPTQEVDSLINASQKDSTPVVKKDAPVIENNKTTAPDEEKKSKKNDWMLAAGLTVYQPLSLNGESPVPYNRYGRKGSLSDYIPAVDFRLYRDKKWFLHTGFRYGAPQSVKPFNYKQEIMTDSFQNIIRSVYQLKKTYYHQVPLSFNYFVVPGLSLGTGIIYNRFGGAVANQSVYRGNNGAVDTLLSSGIVQDPEEKRFVKNHFQWSAEVQYQWRRFTLGARYSKDIDPYIKYTDILTGTSIEKKAEALNIFVRYELWRKR